MPISIPVATNYSSPLISMPTKYLNPPNETPRFIPCEIDWGTMGGPNNSINMALNTSQVQNFSQICALAVDNSACGADVLFYFPDTASSITIPAYTPYCVVPVITNALQFYIVSENALTEDITTFQIHNTVPPPIAVPVTEEQNTAATTTTTVNDGSQHTVQLVASTVNGTLEAVNINVQIDSATSGTVAVILEDGTGKMIYVGQAANSTNGGNNTVVLVDQPNLKVRFVDGLVMKYTATQLSTGSVINSNLYYRTP